MKTTFILFFCSNGDMYLGEYYNDTCLGLGTCVFSNGDKYEGSWHENQMQGYGVYTKRDAEPVAGQWDQGVFKSCMLISDRWIDITLQVCFLICLYFMSKTLHMHQ